MPSPLAVSTRMPPSLRSPWRALAGVRAASVSHRSLGHLRPISGVCRSSCGAQAPGAAAFKADRLSARLIPTTSDRPDHSFGCKAIPSENIRLAARWLCHCRPSRPRPAVCCSATSSVGSVRGSIARPPALSARRPLKRRISSVLVLSISGRISTVKPGKTGSTACQIASAGQRMG